MQRRAAAVSAAIFLLLAVGAYGVLGMSSQPSVETETTAELQNGDSLELGGTTYNVTGTSGGEVTFEWYNASARYSETLTNNSTTTFDGDAAQTSWDDTNLTYRVLVEQGEEPTSVTLREVQEVSEPTITRNGTVFVVVDRDDDGTDEVIPRDEYLPAPRTATFELGDELDYAGNTTDISSITAEEVVLTWTGPKTMSKSVSDGNTITLGGAEYIGYFPEGSNQAILTQDEEGYEDSLDRQDYWSERMRGLWGVVVLGLVGGLSLIGMAYLPSRY
jgi:sorbitol-specific phosphotransferase system component IIA